jgi:hypothetical protein
MQNLEVASGGDAKIAGVEGRASNPKSRSTPNSQKGETQAGSANSADSVSVPAIKDVEVRLFTVGPVLAKALDEKKSGWRQEWQAEDRGNGWLELRQPPASFNDKELGLFNSDAVSDGASNGDEFKYVDSLVSLPWPELHKDYYNRHRDAALRELEEKMRWQPGFKGFAKDVYLATGLHKRSIPTWEKKYNNGETIPTPEEHFEEHPEDKGWKTYRWQPKRDTASGQ